LVRPELYLLDNDGNRLPREDWKTSWVSSEKFVGNHTADKAYDLQESTYWSSDPAEKMPQCLVIDLGGNYEISGFEILPRMETDAPGAIKNYRIYVKDTPFSF
ncbi:MAG: discoidin domain-containing protein, partial [Duncaniella sp.]|nr:discoidin domain-containing protein [Duncaniella sp.]